MGIDSFEPWYRREHPRLVSSLVVIAGDLPLAGEVADEAFVRAYERWDRVGAMTSPAGWTYRTALNVLRRHQRRAALERRLLLRRARADRLDREHLAPPGDWSPEIWEALRDLPNRERTALALRYVADLTTESIAGAMGIAEGTVGSTLHAARHHLAVLLSEEKDVSHRPCANRSESIGRIADG